MSGVKVIRYLLANNAPLVAVVPTTKISTGELPQGIALPAIEVNSISTNWASEISAQSKYASSRVQVTILATSYPQQKSIMELVRTAIPRTGGTINGVNVDCILRDQEGPDFRDDDIGSFMQVQDYFVKYNDS